MSCHPLPQDRLISILDTILTLSRSLKGTCTNPAHSSPCNQAALCMVIMERLCPIHLFMNTPCHNIRQYDIQIIPLHLLPRALHQFRTRGDTCHIAATRTQITVMLTWPPAVLSTQD